MRRSGYTNQNYTYLGEIKTIFKNSKILLILQYKQNYWHELYFDLFSNIT